MFSKIALALCAVFVLASAPALADDNKRSHGRTTTQWHAGYDKNHGGRHYKKHYKKHKHYGRPARHGKAVVVWHGNRHWKPQPRRHVPHYVYRQRPVHRHHHRAYKGRERDNWALYAILALQLADVLNERQQYSYAQAQQRAVAVPLGESIQWSDGGVYGSVTATRDGTDRGGRYCREFQHEVTVGNRLQSAYGTACRQPDGDWEIIS